MGKIDELKKAGFEIIERGSRIAYNGVPCWKIAYRDDPPWGEMTFYNLEKGKKGICFIKHPQRGYGFYLTDTEGEDVHNLRESSRSAHKANSRNIVESLMESGIENRMIYRIKTDDKLDIQLLSKEKVH
jgi:hypothetical protein